MNQNTTQQLHVVRGATRTRQRSCVAALAMLAVIPLIPACSGDSTNAAQDTPQASEPQQSLPSELGVLVLPEYFPKAIELPDEHMVVRNASQDGEDQGREISMNIALPGTVEEWQNHFSAALERDFEEVEFSEDRTSVQWTFSGQGYDQGSLYLNDNSGQLDRGSIDSSHLPVMLTLMMTGNSK